MRGRASGRLWHLKARAALSIQRRRRLCAGRMRWAPTLSASLAEPRRGSHRLFCSLLRAVDGGSLLAAIAILQCFSGDACSSSRLPADSSAGRALLLVDAGLPARARLWHSKVAAFLHADSWACDISSALVKLNAHGSRGSPAPSMRFTLAASTFCEKPWMMRLWLLRVLLLHFCSSFKAAVSTQLSALGSFGSRKALSRLPPGEWPMQQRLPAAVTGTLAAELIHVSR